MSAYACLSPVHFKDGGGDLPASPVSICRSGTDSVGRSLEPFSPGYVNAVVDVICTHHCDSQNTICSQ